MSNPLIRNSNTALEYSNNMDPTRCNSIAADLLLPCVAIKATAELGFATF